MRVAGCALAGRTGHDAGRELLKRLYLEETGLPMPEILTTKRGKPFFPDSPLHFSITHTDRHVFCALGHCPVGIDAEEQDRPVRHATAKRVLSPREMEAYQASDDPAQTFLRLWVLKEAAAKCTGDGLTGFPNHTDFSPDDPRVMPWMNCYFALIREDPNEGVTYHAF